MLLEVWNMVNKRAMDRRGNKVLWGAGGNVIFYLGTRHTGVLS